MTAPLPPAAVDMERLTGLVFELASQLHVERARRIAIEVALEAAGLIDARALAAAAETPEFAGRSAAALDEAMRKIMRVITEGEDPKGPLRAEAFPIDKE